MKWTAYTDGACAPSNPGPAGWGAIVIAPDGQGETDHFGFIGPGTNQIAELTAALEGLNRVPVGGGGGTGVRQPVRAEGPDRMARAAGSARGSKNSKGEAGGQPGARGRQLFAEADLPEKSRHAGSAGTCRRSLQRAGRCAGQQGAGPDKRPRQLRCLNSTVPGVIPRSIKGLLQSPWAQVPTHSAGRSKYMAMKKFHAARGRGRHRRASASGPMSSSGRTGLDGDGVGAAPPAGAPQQNGRGPGGSRPRRGPDACGMKPHGRHPLRSRQGVMLRPEVSGRVAKLGFSDGAARRSAATLLVQLDDTLQQAQLAEGQGPGEHRPHQPAAQPRAASARSSSARAAVDQSAAALEVAEASVALAHAAAGAHAHAWRPSTACVGIRVVNVGDYVKDGADLRQHRRHRPRMTGRFPPARAGAVAPEGRAGGRRHARRPAGRRLQGPRRRRSIRSSTPTAARCWCGPASANAEGAAASPGMFARARLVFAARDDAVVVPEEALVPRAAAKRSSFKVVERRRWPQDRRSARGPGRACGCPARSRSWAA